MVSFVARFVPSTIHVCMHYAYTVHRFEYSRGVKWRLNWSDILMVQSSTTCTWST
jgi:hypothetical protein